MPIAGLSTGKDLSVTITDTNGIVLTTRTKSISVKQNVIQETTKALDGITRHLNIPGGWDASFEFERTSSAIDDYIIGVENAYYAALTIPLITISFSITEANGGISQYQLIGCVPQYEDGGTWKSDGYVTQKVMFKASQFIKLG